MENAFLLLLLGVGLLAAVPLARWVVRAVRRRRAFRLRVAVEDALKHLHGAEERGQRATVESLAGQLGIATRRATEVARLLQERGLATAGAGLALTPAGGRAARQIVRAHRLWERYLADELHAPLAELHRAADQREHLLTADEVDHLAASLGHPQHDPHGDPIPAPDGISERLPGWPVTLVPPGVASEIVHLEDEPEDVFARLAAVGLDVGQRTTVQECAPDRITLDINGRLVELAPIDAANVFVVPTRAEAGPAPRTLADLRAGERGSVRRVTVSGFSRRRLFDLGFTPGALVECAFTSAFGEPKAYRVRNTLIALRPEQARRIELQPPAPAEPA